MVPIIEISRLTGREDQTGILVKVRIFALQCIGNDLGFMAMYIRYLLQGSSKAQRRYPLIHGFVQDCGQCQQKTDEERSYIQYGRHD